MPRNPFSDAACPKCGHIPEETLGYEALGIGFAKDKPAERQRYRDLLRSISPVLVEAYDRKEMPTRLDAPIYRHTPSELQNMSERELLLLLSR